MARIQRSLDVESVLLDSLILDPANARRIDEPTLDSLSLSIREFGLVQPVIARRADRMIIAGHQRVKAAIREGLEAVPVIWLDITHERGRALGLALNKITGTWDEQLLARLIAELEATPDIDLRITGFAEDEIAALLKGLEVAEKRDRPELFDLDAAVDAATRASRSKPGDLWRLGDHRLLHGDATIADDINRALGGTRAAMVFADPPYNVDLGDHGGQRPSSRRRKIFNDAMAPAAWADFVRGWAGTILGATDGACYICMSSKEWPTVAAILAETGGHWSDTIIWAKDRFTLGRADYQRGYEPIWYGWREGARHHWCGDRDQSDIWTIDRPDASPLHPTMKPVELVERALTNSSAMNDLVLDPFVGSGTTIIAGERTGRRVAAVELDPVYVEVAIARWERFTGLVAERVDG